MLKFSLILTGFPDFGMIQIPLWVKCLRRICAGGLFILFAQRNNDWILHGSLCDMGSVFDYIAAGWRSQRREGTDGNSFGFAVINNPLVAEVSMDLHLVISWFDFARL